MSGVFDDQLRKILSKGFTKKQALQIIESNIAHNARKLYCEHMTNSRNSMKGQLTLVGKQVSREKYRSTFERTQEESIKLDALIFSQEKLHGINMMDAMSIQDLSRVKLLMSATGCSEHDAKLMVFEDKFLTHQSHVQTSTNLNNLSIIQPSTLTPNSIPVNPHEKRTVAPVTARSTVTSPKPLVGILRTSGEYRSSLRNSPKSSESVHGLASTARRQSRTISFDMTSMKMTSTSPLNDSSPNSVHTNEHSVSPNVSELTSCISYSPTRSQQSMSPQLPRPLSNQLSAASLSEVQKQRVLLRQQDKQSDHHQTRQQQPGVSPRGAAQGSRSACLSELQIQPPPTQRSSSYSPTSSYREQSTRASSQQHQSAVVVSDWRQQQQAHFNSFSPHSQTFPQASSSDNFPRAVQGRSPSQISVQGFDYRPQNAYQNQQPHHGYHRNTTNASNAHKHFTTSPRPDSHNPPQQSVVRIRSSNSASDFADFASHLRPVSACGLNTISADLLSFSNNDNTICRNDGIVRSVSNSTVNSFGAVVGSRKPAHPHQRTSSNIWNEENW